MKTKHVYICEDTTAGIFTGIYDAWVSRYGHTNNEIRVKEPDNLEFFSEYIYVKTDNEKALKVTKSICSKISEEIYIILYNVSLSNRPEKAEHIYRFLILGFAMGKEVLRFLTNPDVNAVVKIEQNVKKEFFHYEGFLRFVQIKNGILAARFRPENNVLAVVADFFSDRMPDENWIICDEGRRTAAFHEAGKAWFLYQNFSLEEHAGKAEKDEYYRLWKQFVDTIGIKERKNDKLRFQMLPNRYREYMPEVEWKGKK